VAGVEQHEVRILDRLGRRIAFHRQRIGHALGIVDVHLAAIGLDEDLPRLTGGSGRVGGLAAGDRVVQVHRRALAPFRDN
jgi:hypothetical protein